MKTIVFFLEEPSAKEMLEGLLPRILPPDATPRYIVFQGKQDLEKNLVKRLRGWLLPGSVFVVMRDQDAGDCVTVKKRLVDLCLQAGKEDTLVRIACRELESFYLGDLQAVEKGLGLRGIASEQRKSKFRNPDELGNPSEELSKLTHGIYQKKPGSRAIAPCFDLSANKSNSFNVLLAGIKRLIDEKDHNGKA
jgi:hypothetical protein